MSSSADHPWSRPPEGGVPDQPSAIPDPSDRSGADQQPPAAGSSQDPYGRSDVSEPANPYESARSTAPAGSERPSGDPTGADAAASRGSDPADAPAHEGPAGHAVPSGQAADTRSASGSPYEPPSPYGAPSPSGPGNPYGSPPSSSSGADASSAFNGGAAPGTGAPGYGAPGPQQGASLGGPGVPPGPGQSRVLCGLMGIFFGGWGVHRFLMGYTGIGILQIVVTLLTCGVGALWGFIEGIMILVRSPSFEHDAHGRPLTD